ncbi:MAG: T9SS type A sorting domain-containing protein, partial [Sediminibacterium sp.]
AITDDNSCTYNYTFNITDCIGVEELAQASINVFPNPSKGAFTFTHASFKNATWILFDISGKMIHSERFASGSTSTSVNIEVPSGVYSLRIIAEDMQLQKSVVVE